MNDLLKLLDSCDAGELPDTNRREIVKAPFGWRGGKSKALDMILPELPYYKGYVEPFGGSASVLLARNKVGLEVYNDRYGGVTDFYRVIRDPHLYHELQKQLEMYVHSREEWYRCYDTWEKCNDPVDRAARWFYMITYSFARGGDAFGRSVFGNNPTAGLLHSKKSTFYNVHQRFKEIIIENLDFRNLFADYSHPDTVFYCDPPYLESYHDNYFGNSFTEKDHKDLLACIFKSQSFVALSGVDNTLYNEYKWDKVVKWSQYRSAKRVDPTDQDVDADMRNKRDSVHREEVLWIKESH